MASEKLRIGISTDDIERAVDETIDDIDGALDGASKDVAQEGLDAAKNHIRKHDKVWTRRVLNSWTPIKAGSGVGLSSVNIDGGSASLPSGYSGTNIHGFQNYSEHADVVDKGAEYGEKGPPVHKLKPWVRDKLAPYSSGHDVDSLSFWLQKKIKRDGLDGIHYKKEALRVMHQRANPIINKRVARDTR